MNGQQVTFISISNTDGIKIQLKTFICDSLDGTNAVQI